MTTISALDSVCIQHNVNFSGILYLFVHRSHTVDVFYHYPLAFPQMEFIVFIIWLWPISMRVKHRKIVFVLVYVAVGLCILESTNYAQLFMVFPESNVGELLYFSVSLFFLFLFSLPTIFFRQWIFEYHFGV